MFIVKVLLRKHCPVSYVACLVFSSAGHGQGQQGACAHSRTHSVEMAREAALIDFGVAKLFFDRRDKRSESV